MEFRFCVQILIAEFDSTDIEILKQLTIDGTLTQRKLAQILSVPKMQINRRIRRLESEGIIKDYKLVFSPHADVLFIACFIEIDDLVDGVLSSIYQIPHPAYIMMESSKRYCIRLDLTLKDYKGFLLGFDSLRSHLSSYSIQVIHRPQHTSTVHPFNLFNRATKTWDTPLAEYLRRREFLSMQNQ